MKLSEELERVKNLTGATETQIKLHDDGWWSRAYVVNNGEYVIKFPKKEGVDFKHEAKVLNYLSGFNLPINMQRVKELPDDQSYCALFGVKGTQLKEVIKDLTLEQKQKLGKQLGAFIKQLHSIKMDIDGTGLDAELAHYKETYDKLAAFFERYFTAEEFKTLETLMYDYLPQARRNLGEKLMFCHADIFEHNIIIDDDGAVGLIDFANAGYCDEAADFIIGDDVLRGIVLDEYGASKVLRQKAELKADMSKILSPIHHIEKDGEAVTAEREIPIIRGVINKYASANTGKIKLVLPAIEHIEKVAEFKRRWLQETDNHIDGAPTLYKIEPEAWIKECADHREGKNLSQEFVASTMFLAIRESDRKMVGVIQVRHKLVPPWDLIGGHIGYSVAHDERGKGYATEMLRLSLAECKRLGIEKVMVACFKDNAASAQVIKNNGGIFEGEAEKTDGLSRGTIQRYWLPYRGDEL